MICQWKSNFQSSISISILFKKKIWNILEETKKCNVDKIMITKMSFWDKLCFFTTVMVEIEKNCWLTFEIVDVSYDDDVEEFVVGNVGGSNGHHQVPQADQGAVLVREHSHDDVVLN